MRENDHVINLPVDKLKNVGVLGAILGGGGKGALLFWSRPLTSSSLPPSSPMGFGSFRSFDFYRALHGYLHPQQLSEGQSFLCVLLLSVWDGLY